MTRHQPIHHYLSHVASVLWDSPKRAHVEQTEAAKERAKQRANELGRPIVLVASDGSILWETWPA